MGKIDMSKVKTNTDNSAEIKELNEAKPAETPVEPTELTDNASEKSEDTNKTEAKAEAKSEEKTNAKKVVVSYIGSGIWRDGESKLWASKNKTENILCERQYDVNEYEKRDDIKFMVQYGSMRATYVK